VLEKCNPKYRQCNAEARPGPKPSKEREEHAVINKLKDPLIHALMQLRLTYIHQSGGQNQNLDKLSKCFYRGRSSQSRSDKTRLGQSGELCRERKGGSINSRKVPSAFNLSEQKNSGSLPSSQKTLMAERFKVSLKQASPPDQLGTASKDKVWPSSRFCLI
jgi:hypothetical protein